MGLLIGIGHILIGISLLLLLYSPLIFIGVSIILIMCGKGYIVKRWLKKIGKCFGSGPPGFNARSSSFSNGWFSHDDHSSASSRAMESDLQWLSDIHNSPTYDNLPCNSSHNTIGSGSWDH